jgi:hypothetical protein
MRELHTKGRKYFRAIIPSKSTVQLVCKAVDAYTRHKSPYKVDYLPNTLGGGEWVNFEDTPVMQAVVSASGLENAAKTRRITIRASCDTVTITKHNHLMMAGFKINDRSAVTPLTKRPLYIQATTTQKEES